MRRFYILTAIAEGIGLAKGEIGLAYMDLLHPVLCLAQFADTAAYTKLQTKLDILSPVEVLLADSAAASDNRMRPLHSTIERRLTSGAQVTFVSRKSFNESRGKETVRRLCLEECLGVLTDLRDKYYSLACASALVDYVETVQTSVLAAGSIRVIYEGCEESMTIDSNTARELELIANLRTADDVESSLFGILNHTFTNGGARLLRASILQPSRNVATIRNRQAAIEQLINNTQALINLSTTLSSMRDLERSIPALVQNTTENTVRFSECRLKQMIFLMHSLELAQPLLETVTQFDGGVFANYAAVLRDERIEQIMSSIRNYIQDESLTRRGPLKMRNQICFAIRPNLNGLLDIFRRAYTEYIGDIENYHMSFVRETGVPFRLTYSTARGFHFSLNLRDRQEPEPVVLAKLVQVWRRTSCLLCSTEELIQLSERVDMNYAEIVNLSNDLITNLITEIRPHLSYLYNLSEVISSLDFLTSMALHAERYKWVCPQLTDTLAIQKARHPLMESLADQSYIPNDVYAGPDSRFIIITGPNMSGKSTYLKMVGTLQVLAQMGSFVPATMASFRLCDRIFTRVDHNDSLESNSSSFMVEMRDVSHTLNNFTDDSLIIMDELGRNTSDEEGFACCVAICEKFIQSKAFVFLATHFLDLTADLERLYPFVDSYHFDLQTDPASEHGPIDHTLTRGPYMGACYGLQLAQLSQLPKKVLETAQDYLNNIRQHKQKTGGDKRAMLEQRAVMRLRHRLVQVANMSNLENTTILNYMQQLKNDYINELEIAAAVASVSEEEEEA